MSAPDQMHISFRQQSTDYHVQLVQGAGSDHTVTINGVTYAVLGEKDKLKTAAEILNSVHFHDISTFDELKAKLLTRGDLSFPDQKTDATGVSVLHTKATSSLGSKERLELKPVYPDFKKRPIENYSEIVETTDVEFFTQLLAPNSGIFFGDNHHDMSNIQYLISNIPLFAKLGVKHLYVEIEREHLPDFEAFNASKEGDEAYYHFLSNRSGEVFGDDFYPESQEMNKALFIQAKRHGIDVRAIDAPLSDEIDFDENGEILGEDNKQLRINSANAEWIKAVQEDKEELQPGQKYLIFGGAAHARKHGQTQGVSEALGIPSVSFFSQHVFRPVRKANTYFENATKYCDMPPSNKASLDPEFRLCVPPSHFEVGSDSDMSEFVLPVKDYRINLLCQSWRDSFQEKMHLDNVALEYWIGKTTRPTVLNGDAGRQFTSETPAHHIEIQSDHSKFSAMKPELVKQWREEWKALIRDEKLEVSSNEKGISLSFFTNSDFEKFLSAV